jgi:TolB-like protein
VVPVRCLALNGLLLMGPGACAPASLIYRSAAVLAADSAVRAALEREETLDPSTFPPFSVGVLPFRVATDDPTLEPLGHGLAALLMTDLARSGRVDVVDRLRIDAVLRELELTRVGIADPATGPRAGRLLGARQLVYGSVDAAGPDALRLDARLVLTATAVVRPVVTGTASLDEILDAEKAVAFEVFDALGVNLTPAERAAIEQRRTRSLSAFLAFSRGVRAESDLRLLDAERYYRAAIDLDPSFDPPRERIQTLDIPLFDAHPIGLVSIDAINPPGGRSFGDVTEPAFQGGETAVLVIPLVIR